MENSMEIPQKIKNKNMVQQSHFWVFIKKTKTLPQKDICTPMFLAALFIIAKICSNLSTHQWMNE